MARLRAYQIHTIERALHLLEIHRQVLIVMPTGSGKTYVGTALALAARERGMIERAAVFVPTRRIGQQWTATIQRLGAVGVLEVWTYQAGYRRVEDLVRRYDLAIFDEGHHAPAPAWGRLVGAGWRAGEVYMTATPNAGPLERRQFLKSLPKVVVEAGELVKAGWLKPVRVYVVDLSDEPTLASEIAEAYRRVLSRRAWSMLDEAARVGLLRQELERRVKLAAAVPAAAAACRGGALALALFEMVSTVTRAVDVTASLGAGCRVHVHTGRRSTLEGAQPPGIVYATKAAAGEGLDVPELDAVILAHVYGSAALAQAAGRAARPAGPWREAVLAVLAAPPPEGLMVETPEAEPLAAVRRSCRSPGVRGLCREVRKVGYTELLDLLEHGGVSDGLR